MLVGLGPTAPSALQSLLGAVDVLAVVRDGGQAADDPVRQLADRHGVAVHASRPRGELEDLIASIRPDAVVVSSYNRVFGRDVLGVCPFINVHYAPLPRYRGNAPVNWAIINGEPSTAITIHLIDAGLDSGAVLHQEDVPIAAEDTATTLFDKLNELQLRRLGPTVARALATGWRGRPQAAEAATYGCARGPDDGEIGWSGPADAIARLVRALAPPFPGAFTFHQGRMLLVHRAAAVPAERHYAGAVPGRVTRLSTADGWAEVLTGRGVLRVQEVAWPGEPARRATDLIRSTRAKLGVGNAELLRRVEALEARLARLEAGSRNA